jgi:protein-disulfide isomerase-like protein with CxxC motif
VLKGLESMLLEIQRRSLDLDNLAVSLEFKQSWKATVSLLEKAMTSLQDWLANSFGSLDLERLGRKQLLQRIKFFFADKKLKPFRRPIDEHID